MALLPTAPVSFLRAAATLGDATRFLGAGLYAAPALPRAIAGTGRAKVIGNGLRELDRFLNLLIDEIAALHVLPPAFDPPQFARRRNTPAKLRALRSALALPDPDHARLRAIGRTRDCLFHCGGIVRRVGITAEGIELPLGARLAMHPPELAGICRLYARLGVELAALAPPR